MSWPDAKLRIRDILLGVKVTNLFKNPSFETDILGAVPDATLTAVLDPTVGKVGTSSLKCTGSAAAVETVFFRLEDGVTRMPVTGGKVYTWSLHAKTDFTFAGHIGVRYFDAGGVSIVSSFGSGIVSGQVSTVAAAEGWKRLSYTTVAPSNAVSAETDIEESVGWGAGKNMWLDGVNFIQGGDIPYIDGDQPGGAWDGVAHADTSNRGIRRVYLNPPPTIQDWPCAIIYPPSLPEIRRGSGLREKDYRCKLRLIMTDEDADVASELVDTFREIVVDAFDVDVTLGGRVTQAYIESIEEMDTFNYGNKPFIGMESFLRMEMKESFAFA